MGCRGFWECLLKLLNFLMTLAGLAMVGYGIYLFVMYKQDNVDPVLPPVSGDDAFIQLGRPFLMTMSLSNNILDNLPKAWFIYLFIGVGALLFVISCCGCIGASTRNGCCLTTYAVFIILLILVEIGCAAFMFFNEDWDKEIPKDKTGNFENIFDFLDDHWGIVKWVLLGIVVLEALLFVLTVIVRAVNMPADYDSDEEFINPRQSFKQPLINKPTSATSVPVTGSDQRTTRSDAWSARMREKYGLDTAEFTYNPNDPTRYQQSAAQPTEERKCCTIM
ncbi:hypothetical protein RND81_13G018300 [Saponaria officinalis]|uniref:Tobamovirus multiplication protein 2A n=1 Tax=Saponaria officinalis TaxID=3572 RepID=A0AAW1GVX4_SAPOF